MALAEKPPEPLLSYFQDFIEEMMSLSKGKLYRYGAPPESAMWVAERGFAVKRSKFKKMSTTLFPILNTEFIIGVRNLLITFKEDLFEYAVAVTYTHDFVDPITGDPVATYELELAIYSSEKKKWGPTLEFVGLMYLHTARLLRNVEVDEDEYRQSRVLLQYLYNRVWTRYNFTMVPMPTLIRYLAVETILLQDNKMRYAFAIAWDRYWEAMDKIAYPPNYEKATFRYNQEEFSYVYSRRGVQSVCQECYVRCDEGLISRVLEEVSKIYERAGEEIKIESYEGVETAPHIDRELSLKWWHGDEESFERYLEELRQKEVAGVHRYPPTFFDPSIEVEDWWEP